MVHATGIAFAGQPRAHQDAHVEQCPEEAEEKHHLGKDEPEHSQDVGLLQLGTVHASYVLLDSHSEPAEQGGGEEKQAKPENGPGTGRLARLTKGHVIHDAGGTKNAEDQADGGANCQLALLRYVILFVLCGSLTRHLISPLW